MESRARACGHAVPAGVYLKAPTAADSDLSLRYGAGALIRRGAQGQIPTSLAQSLVWSFAPLATSPVFLCYLRRLYKQSSAAFSLLPIRQPSPGNRRVDMLPAPGGLASTNSKAQLSYMTINNTVVTAVRRLQRRDTCLLEGTTKDWKPPSTRRDAKMPSHDRGTRRSAPRLLDRSPSFLRLLRPFTPT